VLLGKGSGDAAVDRAGDTAMRGWIDVDAAADCCDECSGCVRCMDGEDPADDKGWGDAGVDRAGETAVRAWIDGNVVAGGCCARACCNRCMFGEDSADDDDDDDDVGIGLHGFRRLVTGSSDEEAGDLSRLGTGSVEGLGLCKV